MGLNNMSEMFLPGSRCSALAKFRVVLSPLRVETGRYDNTPLSDRVCSSCSYDLEDEKHVLSNYYMYEAEKSELLFRYNEVYGNFGNFNTYVML